MHHWGILHDSVFVWQNWAHTMTSVCFVWKAEDVGRSNCHYLFPLKVGHTVWFHSLHYTTVSVDCSMESFSVRLSHPAATSGLSTSCRSQWGQLLVNTESFRVTISSSHTALNAWAETRAVLCSSQYSVLIEWQVSVTDWMNVRLKSLGTSRCLFYPWHQTNSSILIKTGKIFR